MLVRLDWFVAHMDCIFREKALTDTEAEMAVLLIHKSTSNISHDNKRPHHERDVRLADIKI